VYGFERIGETESIDEKVRQYLPMLREIAPHGPYRLAGWSFGGAVAYEMAYQLEQLGEQTEILALIDTVIPTDDPNIDPVAEMLGRYERFADHMFSTYGKRLDIPFDALVSMTEMEQLQVLMNALGSAGIDMPAAVLEHQYTSYVDSRIAERYQPKPREGRTILYRASELEAVAATVDPRYLRTDESAGWDQWCSDLDIVRVPGHHISIIDRPNVDVIATHLESVLAGRMVKS
jgi:phthiocerol/phenolphthiocerol synthesis type-I polyketide synthase D